MVFANVSPSDPLALPALVIALVAVLVAAIALAWQIVSWKRSGHRVLVQLEVIVHNPKRGLSWTGKRGKWGWRASSIPPSRVAHSVVQVNLRARNRGRAAVDVERFFVMVGRVTQQKNRYWTFHDDSPLPQRIEPGASASRSFLLQEVESFVKHENKRRFRGAVALGDGSTRRSRLSFSIRTSKRGTAFLQSDTGQNLQSPPTHPKS